MEDNRSTNKNKEILKRLCCIVKENIALISLVLPIILAIAVAIINYFFYMYNCGYYNYFKIESKWMLPLNKFNIYEYIQQMGLFLVYWAFTFLAARVFSLKGNWIWKFILFFIVPFGINCTILIIGGTDVSITLLIAGMIVIPVHWAMIYFWGNRMIKLLKDEDTWLDKVIIRIKKDLKKQKGEPWGDTEYNILSLIVILLGCIAVFAYCFWAGNRTASTQKRFGIINIDNESYAVIDVNDSKLILEACEIEDTTLKINKDTYLCIDNNMNIYFNTFETVLVE